MKNYNLKNRSFSAACFCRLAGCLSLLLMGVVSCTPTSNPENVKLTPLQTLVNTDTTLSFFHRMLLQGNDAALLADKPITWLMPTNTAFRAAGYTDAGIDTLKANFANNLIRYHYILTLITLNNGIYTGFMTSRGDSVYGMPDNGQIWFNGIPAAGDPATVGNALVYRLNQAPLPSAADSLDPLLAGDSSLSLLAQVVRRLPAIDSLLSSGGYTLFAPVNSAFMAAGYADTSMINAADSASLVLLVKNQASQGIYFSNTLLGLTSLTNLEGGVIGISTQGGTNLQFKGSNNAVPANWLSGNQTAGSRLVVHRIDQVLSSAP
ncbi:fasciclin domain-containing protein [Flavitalea flava]